MSLKHRAWYMERRLFPAHIRIGAYPFPRHRSAGYALEITASDDDQHGLVASADKFSANSEMKSCKP